MCVKNRFSSRLEGLFLYSGSLYDACSLNKIATLSSLTEDQRYSRQLYK